MWMRASIFNTPLFLKIETLFSQIDGLGAALSLRDKHLTGTDCPFCLRKHWVSGLMSLCGRLSAFADTWRSQQQEFVEK